MTKRELKESEENQKRNLLDLLTNCYKDSKISSWLEGSLTNKQFYNKVMHLLINDNKSIYNILNALIDRISNPDFINLSIFSSRITKDPHYFDIESNHTHHLIWFICYYYEMDFNNTRSYKIEILNGVGVYTDNVSNFIITYNLCGSKYLDDLSKRKEVAILSLNNINNLNKVYAKNNKIIILENPSLLEVAMSKKYSSAFIITSGNPNIACYRLLDKLKESKLYYNGDFDPEGLLIANKLIDRYSNLELFGYSSELFVKAISNKKISLSRMKKLNNVTNVKLRAIKECIIHTNSVGYQEKIIEDLLTNIDRINKN